MQVDGLVFALALLPFILNDLCAEITEVVSLSNWQWLVVELVKVHAAFIRSRIFVALGNVLPVVLLA